MTSLQSPVWLAHGWNLVGISENVIIEDFINASGGLTAKDFDGFYEDGTDSISTLEKGKAYLIQ